MIIAVNTRYLLPGCLAEYGIVLYECLKRITAQHSEHSFIFIFESPYKADFIFTNNITPVVISRQPKHPLLKYIWYNFKVSAILKKYKADVFLTDGICSLRTKIPQCLVLHDLNFLHSPENLVRSVAKFNKKHFPKFLKKAAVLVTGSEIAKQKIANDYKIAPAKIEVVYAAAQNDFQPIPAFKKDFIKQRYTNGKEYFLFTDFFVSQKNLIHVLKAFSIFKKRLKSNMQLVIDVRIDLIEHGLSDLQTFKFKDDVKVFYLQHEPDSDILMAAAYALIYPCNFEYFGVIMLEALQCEVPVIICNADAMPEISGDAALCANATIEELADKMMLIYKDENLRRQLIEKGNQQIQHFSWDKTAERLWESIIKTTA